jgi:hypothetical protein
MGERHSPWVAGTLGQLAGKSRMQEAGDSEKSNGNKKTVGRQEILSVPGVFDFIQDPASRIDDHESKLS